MPPLRTAASALLPLVVWGGAIFAASAQSELPSVPLFRGADKVIHFVEFAVLGALVARALGLLTRLPPPRCAALAAILGCGYGFVDELHQFFVPGRDSSPADLAADALGSVAGTGLWLAWARRRRRATLAGEEVPR